MTEKIRLSNSMTMANDKHRRCILDSCCLCFSVETGAKIIGYLGVVSNSVNIIISIVMIVALAVDPTPPPDPIITTTTDIPVDFTDLSLIDDVNVNYANLPGLDINNNVVNTIIFLVFGLVLNIFELSSNVVLLIGLYKKLPSYVKFGLVVGVVTVTLAFVITIATVIAVPTAASILALLYLVVPVYLLLVIRSAYLNMLEGDVIEPVYTFGQSFTKGSYHAF